MTEADVASAAGADDLGDEVLLERFASRRDEAAFAALVRRYGPLVHGVCRRVLRHEQDAEDVFQAVFCVLARKAASIRRRGAAGAWLHGVACRLAQKARTRRGRLVAASNLPDVPAVEPPPEWEWQELRPILDEEVNRLPAKYRQTFIACYFEGRTNEQAAAQLGCPLGTVLSRLNRAREQLRSRLTRRGVALSVGALAAVLGSPALGSAVPPGLTQTAVQTAAAFAGGATPASNAATLANEFLRALTRRRLLQAAAGLAGLLTIAGVVLWVLRWTTPHGDFERIQGVWRTARVAQPAGPAGPVANMNFTFTPGRLTLSMEGAPSFSAGYRLDPTRDPKEITLTTPEGLTWPGIYKFSGNTLHLCINHRGFNQPDARPTQFTTSPDTPTVFVYQLMRAPIGPDAVEVR